jgi:hypothetical protein
MIMIQKMTMRKKKEPREDPKMTMMEEIINALHAESVIYHIQHYTHI